VYSIEDHIFIDSLFKFKNYCAKNLLDNFMATVVLFLA